MAFEKRYQAAPDITTPPCRHMRSKSIYVKGDLKDPFHPDETGAYYTWCNLTQHIIGPDNKECERSMCVPGRECYCQSF